jgi:hypothetical protein
VRRRSQWGIPPGRKESPPGGEEAGPCGGAHLLPYGSNWCIFCLYGFVLT